MRRGTLVIAAAALALCRGSVLAQDQSVPHATLPPCVAGDADLLLPDLVPDAPRDLRNVYLGSHRVIQFTTAVGNIGDGPLVLEGRTISTLEGLVTQGYQIIWRRDGSRCARPTGRFAFHSGHGHFHFDDFVGYELRVDAVDGALAARGSKASFCLLDLARVSGFSASNYPRQVLNRTCNSAEGMQGISVGWKDVYERFLPGQSIDLDAARGEQVPTGSYVLVNHVDPDQLIWDKNRENNRSFTTAGVSLPPPTLTSFFPPPTPRPVNPNLRPGRVRPTRAPRPVRTARPRPVRTRPGAVPAPMVPTLLPTPIASPTPAPPPMAASCDTACSYKVSQVRMTWYGGVNFSAVIGPGSCGALEVESGAEGTVQMTRFLTQRREDTGHSHITSWTLGGSGVGATSANGTVQFSNVVDSVRFGYSAPVPAVATYRDGMNFPVAFDFCLTVGSQAVKTRLVCQPKPQGMLCHQG